MKGPEKSEEIDVSLTNKGDSYEDESDAIRFAPLSSQKRFPLEREKRSVVYYVSERERKL